MTPTDKVLPTPDTGSDGVPSAETILVVEDDPRMQRVLQRLFLSEGYRVLLAGNGRVALEVFQAEKPILVVLDLILPEISGRELCPKLKALSSGTPIIILSAISDVVDKVLLFELGADDYVTKPFSPRELMARAQSSLRRNRRPQATTSDTVQFGACVVDFSRMTAKRGDVDIVLTSLEFKLLRFLTMNAELVITREALLTHVWGYNNYPTTRTVDNLILKLRQKLEQEPANPRHLITVYGSGYKFAP